MMLLVSLLALLLPTVFADTPANCSYDEIQGTWSFHIGDKGYDNTIDCSSFSAKTELTVQLLYPDVAVDEYGNKGFWTLIYNQGFEVVVANHKFFAFSSYSMINKSAAVSHCDSTLNGWYHDLWDHNWACYYGVKVSDGELDADYNRKVNRFPSLDHLEQKFVKNLDYIAQINNKTNLWQAAHYPELEGMSLRERLQRGGGVPKYGRFPFPPSSKASREARFKASILPDHFDWRDTGCVSPIRNQGSCGSCYAFSSMGMLEARYRLMTNNSMQPIFSPQDVVSCSEYAQGCEGGFPYLIAGKYAEDFGVVEEACNQYTAHDSACREEPNCLRYHSTNYYYVGGYYGACSEEAMQLELVQNGPMSVCFEVYGDCLLYTSPSPRDATLSRMPSSA